MRVIAGSGRGKRLEALAGIKTRPTSDRVKEALFSILTSRFDFSGRRVLDLCAGTGGLGIEALSRGAACCCFIEKDRDVKELLDKNLKSTSFSNLSNVIMLDAVNGLKLLARRAEIFDFIFFDPPYATKLYNPVLELIAERNLLAEDGVLVVESASRNSLDVSFGKIVRTDRRIYGDTSLEFFELFASTETVTEDT